MIADTTPLAPPSTTTDRDWEAIEASPDFRALVKSRWRFALPATIFFLAYYFALPVLSGYAPALMSRPVLGQINVANLFALSEFVMVAVVMALYVNAAKSYDSQAEAVVAKIRSGRA